MEPKYLGYFPVSPTHEMGMAEKPLPRAVKYLALLILMVLLVRYHRCPIKDVFLLVREEFLAH